MIVLWRSLNFISLLFLYLKFKIMKHIYNCMASKLSYLTLLNKYSLIAYCSCKKFCANWDMSNSKYVFYGSEIRFSWIFLWRIETMINIEIGIHIKFMGQINYKLCKVSVLSSIIWTQNYIFNSILVFILSLTALTLRLDQA